MVTPATLVCVTGKECKTRSSWLNCALRDDEAVYWVSIGHYEAVAVGNWWHWVSRGHLCLYILHKVEIWKGVTYAWQTTLKDRATQLLTKYKSGALVTQCNVTTWSCRTQSQVYFKSSIFPLHIGRMKNIQNLNNIFWPNEIIGFMYWSALVNTHCLAVVVGYATRKTRL